LIQIQTDRIHLIFERVDAKPKVRREKRGGRRKKFHQSSTVVLSYTCV
jgi:hypothetical protein